MATTHIVDTNILIDHLRGFKQISDALASIGADIVSTALSTITAVEVYTGMINPAHSQAQEAELIFSMFRLIPPDLAIAKAAGVLRVKYRIELGDAIIAATAQVHGAVLVTRNCKHFEMVREITVSSPP